MGDISRIKIPDLASLEDVLKIAKVLPIEEWAKHGLHRFFNLSILLVLERRLEDSPAFAQDPPEQRYAVDLYYSNYLDHILPGADHAANGTVVLTLMPRLTAAVQGYKFELNLADGPEKESAFVLKYKDESNTGNPEQICCPTSDSLRLKRLITGFNMSHLLDSSHPNECSSKLIDILGYHGLAPFQPFSEVDIHKHARGVAVRYVALPMHSGSGGHHNEAKQYIAAAHHLRVTLKDIVSTEFGKSLRSGTPHMCIVLDDLETGTPHNLLVFDYGRGLELSFPPLAYEHRYRNVQPVPNRQGEQLYLIPPEHILAQKAPLFSQSHINRIKNAIAELTRPKENNRPYIIIEH